MMEMKVFIDVVYEPNSELEISQQTLNSLMSLCEYKKEKKSTEHADEWMFWVLIQAYTWFMASIHIVATTSIIWPLLFTFYTLRST